MDTACWLWKKIDPGFWNQVPQEISLHHWLEAQDHWLGRSTGTTSGNCQSTETCKVWTCLTLWQPLQNHSLGHFGGWAMPWSAEEMLDGQHKRVDIPSHARTAHNSCLQWRLEDDLCWIVPYVPLMTQSVKGLNWTDHTKFQLNWIRT